MRRPVIAALGAVLVVALVAVTAAGWYYSDQILSPGGGALAEERTDVLGVDGDVVTLEATPISTRPGHFGLRFTTEGPAGRYDGGYALAAPPSAAGRGWVRRPVEPVTGDVRHAESVVFDGAYFPADPGAAFDFRVTEVDIQGESGVLPAYLDDRGSDTWVVFVHGRGSSRREGFRILSTLHEMGVSTLLISYRNDEGAPAGEGGRYGMGSTEWRDLQAAVRYAQDAGAARIVLAGTSTGGAIIGAFLRLAPEAGAVSATILDAPVVDWGPVLRLAARQRGLPVWLSRVAMTVAELRGIPWADLNQLQRPEDLTVPTLVFHGAQDSTVPVATSRQLAEARPDLVTLVVVADADHVQAWNVDPGAYAQAVATFLSAVPGIHVGIDGDVPVTAPPAAA